MHANKYEKPHMSILYQYFLGFSLKMLDKVTIIVLKYYLL